MIATAARDELLETLPPSNIEAEQAVLGALLVDPDSIARIADWLRPDHFVRDGHRCVYEAALRLYAKNAPLDIVTIADEIERHQQLAETGGIGYLHSLATVVPTAVHIDHYAGIVQRTAMKRRLISTGALIARAGYDDSLDLKEALDKAQHLLADLLAADRTKFEGVFSVGDYYEQAFHLYENGWQGGEATCWPEFDDHYHISLGELTILQASPGTGKSEFCDALMMDLAKRKGWGFAIFSPENWPVEQHLLKLGEKYLGWPLRDGPTPKADSQELVKAMAFMDEHLMFLAPPSGQRDVAGLVKQCELVLTKRPNTRGLVIDPWNRVEHARPKNMTTSEYAGASLDQLTELAKRAQIHVWVVIHPHALEKSYDSKLKRKVYATPGIYDANDGAAFVNRCDNFISIWRDQAVRSDIVEFTFQKVRNRNNGRTGRVKLKWNPIDGGFISLTEMDKLLKGDSE